MTAILAVSESAILVFGSVLFIAIFAAALSLAYIWFNELGD